MHFETDDPDSYQEGMEKCIPHRKVSQENVVAFQPGLKITRENKERALDPPPTLSFISGKLLCQWGSIGIFHNTQDYELFELPNLKRYITGLCSFCDK